ncbi:Mitogen-activated protein kinase kinase 1 [Apostasia shenzhenica]|uniref:Mitogen-activated protein kinase kinase 1 n=1 Tax=Apostasia shenzhenica TaxID=1088818 RepID=A0A2I0AVH8_9ASPA|nr:Mitogen-activated protein kinase kinase 1 [Apostasia shenzhenica]
MEKKDNLLQPSASSGLLRPAGEANLTSSSSSSSHSSTASPPDFLRQLHAVFKQRRPLGTMRARATRLVDPQKGQMKTCEAAPSLTGGNVGNVARQTLCSVGAMKLKKEVAADITGNPSNESSSFNPSSSTDTLTSVREENKKPNDFGMQKQDAAMTSDRKRTTSSTFPSTLELETQVIPVNDGLKKVQLSSGCSRDITFQSACTLMKTDTKMDEISSYLRSLALTEDDRNLGKGVDANEKDLNQGAPNMEISRSGMVSADLEKMKERSHNQSCLESGTKSTGMCSSCITTISVHSGPVSQFTHPTLPGQTAFPSQMGQGAVMREGSSMQDNKEGHHNSDGIMKSGVLDNAGSLKSQFASTINPPPSSADMKPPQSSKAEKDTRTKKYDPNVFFKVNGKLYQRLGKIGSGGSSEVHKVISADCTIYALKKIRLKGRDYPTAYGFCQEIEYLRKLKGKGNIIQLIDYEVTDKTLLQEAMETSMTSKDGRIKNDQYIYMVLEYGEIDLAHMLCQKWKDIDNSKCSNIDENWLRFYWQQMLEAVRTIHEERIVHSDLKPANFLLVRGSLKLIDFGIAKAIMSDTTNIQRDAQVGTLNYMSPESFMWSEQDQSGGTIKCGRPSDIWSLGCILYQMAYGKTPFSDYKSFWAKFKAITDINHEIVYEPVANPWLIDLMKRCLERDRNKRWRIPELLQHPFLAPPIPSELASGTTGDDIPCQLLFQRVGLYWNEPEVSRLCSQLHSVVSRIEKERELGSTNQ